VLDLTGRGINITPSTSSNTFYDMAGDGYQHLTAWAGAGNGVLVYDPNGTGQITEQDQVVFTDWDPTATSDMQALLDVFDTNHDGKLDAGDSKFADFKVMVTESDGTHQLESLSQLGITSIDLTSNKQAITLADGSSISGETTYTRADGTTGTAADATLAYEGRGFNVRQTTAHNAGGSTTLDSKAYNADGSLAGEITSTTSVDGAAVSLAYDGNGDGVIDRRQVDHTVHNADGSTTATVTDENGAGTRAEDRTVTTTSADLKTATIGRDLNGDGAFDQTETDRTGVDGSLTATVTNLNRNGSAAETRTTATSADGLAKTVRTDLDGNGTVDASTTDDTVVGAGGSRTETVTDYAGSGMGTAVEVDRAVTTTSVDGSSKIVRADLNGDGTVDATISTELTVNSDGSSTTTATVINADGSVRDRVQETISADDRTITTLRDRDGNGSWDTESVDATIFSADGTKSETVSDSTLAGGSGNQTATLRDQSVTTTSADGRTRTIQTDSTGDGQFDRIETIAPQADGSTLDTVKNYGIGGVLIDDTVTGTSAGGSASAVKTDSDGNGSVDALQTTATVHHPDGSSTITVTNFNGSGTVETGKTVTTTSADGLTRAVQTFLGADASADATRTDATVVNADGSRTETVTNVAGSGHAQTGKVVTTTSADRQSVTVSTYLDARTSPDRVVQTATAANGTVTQTVSDYDPTGATLLDKTVTTTSADGLSTSVAKSVPGNTAHNSNQSDATALNSDGTRTQTYTDKNGAGAVVNQVARTTSANGYAVTTAETGSNGSASLARSTTDKVTLGSDGSRLEVVTDNDANGHMQDQSTTTTAGDGLSSRTTLAIGSAVELLDTTEVQPGGGSTIQVDRYNTSTGALAQGVTTTTSADGRTTTIARDSTGAGYADHVETLTDGLDGSTTDVIRDLGSSGSAKDQVTTVISPDGLSKRVAIDTDGDGAANLDRTDDVVVNEDGSRTETRTDLNGDGTVRGQSVATTSADGLTKTTQTALNGTGVVDETETDHTTLNQDGSTTTTSATVYADGSKKDGSTVATSADGRTVTTQWDTNGDGAADETQTKVTNADGGHTTTLSYANSSSSTVTTVSGDGSVKAVQTLSGGKVTQTQTTTIVPDSDGSSSWVQTNATGAVTASSSHTVDANGVDSVAWNFTTPPDGSTASAAGSVQLDAITEAQDQAKLGRLANTLLDRDLSTAEQQSWSRYVGSNSLNETQFANDLMNSTEFKQDYGGLSNVGFLDTIYQNALGRTASLSEMESDLTALAQGTATRASLAIAIAEGTEHLSVGDGHASSVAVNATTKLEHTTDKVVATDEVTQLYRTVVDQAGDSSTIAGYVQAIVKGQSTIGQVAAAILGSSAYASAYGTPSDADFVDHTYENALGRPPTQEEEQFWTSALLAGALSRADIAVAVAQNLDLTVDVTGSNVSVTQSGVNVTVENNASATVGGSEDAIVLKSDDTLAVTGQGDAVTVEGTNDSLTSSSGLITVQGGAQAAIDGSSDTIDIAGSATVAIDGSNDRVQVSGSGANLSLDGSGDFVAMDDGSLQLADGSSATLEGSNGAVSLGSNDTLRVDGQNDTVTAYGQDDTVTVAGPGDNVTLNNTDSSVTAKGDGGSLTLNGEHDIATIEGAHTSLEDGANYTTITDTGANTSIDLRGSGTTVTSTGASTTVDDGGGGNSITTSGSDDTITIGGPSTTIDDKGDGGSLTLNGEHDIATIEGAHTSLEDGANYTTITDTGANTSIDLRG